MNRDEFPPHGWYFYQPQTNWPKTDPARYFMGKTFKQVCSEIIQHRRANLFVTQKHNLALDATAVANELEKFTRVRLGIPDTPAPSPKSSLHHPVGVGVVEHSRRTIAGVSLLVDWLGDDLQPVDKQLADKRAAVCVSCPQNQSGDFWQRLDAKAANMIRTLISVSKDMKLQTTADESLHSCMACDCFIPLKIWTKLPHILKHTSPEVKAKLDPRCWITAEEKQ